MPSYELIYFNARGRAEEARILFALAGVEYKDTRIDQEKDWTSFKSKTTFGVLPNLTIDGEKTVSMSQAIANYLAREFGLYGKDNHEATRIDTTCNALKDIMDQFYGFVFADEASKEEKKKKFLEKTENYVAGFETFLKENKGGDSYFAGDCLSLADIAFFNAFLEIKTLKPDALDNTPKLKALLDRVASNKSIAEWVKTRPQTKT